jgi:hypothetical protein
MMHFVPDSREPRRALRGLWRRIRMADRRLFPLLSTHFALCVKGLRELSSLLGDVQDAEGRLREIEAIEKRADRVVDEVRALLRGAWWPPFSSNEALKLINTMDDVIDVVEDAAESLHLYHVTQVTPEAQRLADLAVDAVLLLQTALDKLARLDDPRAILALCAQVDDLEAQADHVLRSAMSKLFREEPDVRQLIKLKAIYEVLESLTDRCKDVAGDLEAITLRHG